MEGNGPTVRTLNHVTHHPVAQNGVVQIKTAESATVNGNGSANEGSSSPGVESPAAGKLFVGGLSWQTSSEKLRQYFGMFGNITDVLIMKDPVTQVSYFYFYGFVTTIEKSFSIAQEFFYAQSWSTETALRVVIQLFLLQFNVF